MNEKRIVTPSLQVDNTLPNHINENYATFVSFMESAAESEERQGFGQDVLQNLLRYISVSNYKDKIVQYSRLNISIDAEAEELTLSSGFGFPEENGIVLIGEGLSSTNNVKVTLCMAFRGALAVELSYLPFVAPEPTYRRRQRHIWLVKTSRTFLFFSCLLFWSVCSSLTPQLLT